MIALDLFCGAGGASKGLFDAGFDMIRGIDINPQPEYIDLNEFVQADVFDWLENPNECDYDFIWASPPCQAYTYASKKARNLGNTYPDLVGITRELLLKIGKPFVIENVTTAPLRKDLVLCGEMFGLKVIRHRAFEIFGFGCLQPRHIKHRGTVKSGAYVTVAGHGGDGVASLNAWQDAIGVDWVRNKKTLAQCVPPKYSEYIAKQFLGSSLLKQSDKEEKQ